MNGYEERSKKHMYKPKFAYAIWPWGLNTKKQMIQALKDIKEVGFTKFESVRNAIDVFKNNAHEFKAITDEYGVYPVSFYFHQTGDAKADVEEVRSKIEFLKINNVHRMSIQRLRVTCCHFPLGRAIASKTAWN